MTEDCFTKQSVKKWDELCKEHKFYRTREEVLAELKFYCFDSIENENNDIPFIQRHEFATLCMMRFPDIAFPVEQVFVNNTDEVEKYFEKVLEEGFEGLIIRNAKSPYKYGRTRISENNSYKLKPWVTEDAKIIGFVQATKVNEDAEKTITNLGESHK
jgi:ATP-dependent DNA ligase